MAMNCLRDAGSLVPVIQDDEPVRLGIRQRPQQHGLDDREHGDVGADAERKRQHRRRCEAGLANEQAERVANEIGEHGPG